jgi:hypothetical protein
MSRIGNKSTPKIQAVGNKVMFPTTIGSKLTRNIVTSSKSPEETNIYNNSSNTHNVAYMPIGLNKHTNNQFKSHIEKRH